MIRVSLICPLIVASRLAATARSRDPQTTKALKASTKRSPACRSFPATFLSTGTRERENFGLRSTSGIRSFSTSSRCPPASDQMTSVLDRGQLGNSFIVRFDRTGPKVLLVAPNYDFRALTNNPDEKLAVKDAFAESTLWGFEVAAEEGWSCSG